jgi:hypothetical protein
MVDDRYERGVAGVEFVDLDAPSLHVLSSDKKKAGRKIYVIAVKNMSITQSSLDRRRRRSVLTVYVVLLRFMRMCFLKYRPVFVNCR